MVKFDISGLRHLARDDFRVLTAIEQVDIVVDSSYFQGMKNHELVPVELIDSIAALRRSATIQKNLANLLRLKLLRHDRKKCRSAVLFG